MLCQKACRKKHFGVTGKKVINNPSNPAALLAGGEDVLLIKKCVAISDCAEISGVISVTAPVSLAPIIINYDVLVDGESVTNGPQPLIQATISTGTVNFTWTGKYL